MEGTWTFKPDAGEKVSIPDSDFLEYGFWLAKTVEDGETTYTDVSVFAAPQGYGDWENTTGVDTIDGTATYAGDAAGVYVHDSLGATTGSTTGTFTADVSLTAYFGGPDVAVNKKNTIDGSISNFDLSGGEPNAWGISLKKANFNAVVNGEVAVAGNPKNIFGGTADGGGASGSWRGIFHGEPVDGDAPDSKLAPPAVTGEFNANFVNGAAAGAFGAEKK